MNSSSALPSLRNVTEIFTPSVDNEQGNFRLGFQQGEERNTLEIAVISWLEADDSTTNSGFVPVLKTYAAVANLTLFGVGACKAAVGCFCAKKQQVCTPATTHTHCTCSRFPNHALLSPSHVAFAAGLDAGGFSISEVTSL